MKLKLSGLSFRTKDLFDSTPYTLLTSPNCEMESLKLLGKLFDNDLFCIIRCWDVYGFAIIVAVFFSLIFSHCAICWYPMIGCFNHCNPAAFMHMLSVNTVENRRPTPTLSKCWVQSCFNMLKHSVFVFSVGWTSPWMIFAVEWYDTWVE